MATITGGTALEEKLAEIASKLEKKATLKVGFLEGATYPDGTPVAMVAAIQNFGAPGRNIPPRPFFSNMVKDKSPEWPEAIAKLLPAHDYDVERVLALMGEGIKGQLQQAIIDTDAPPLSDITLMLRQMKAESPDLVVTGKTVGEAAARVAAGEKPSGVSTKPLIETAHMLNSVDYDVET